MTNQDRVHAALQSGITKPAAIVRHTGLTRSQVRVALAHLEGRGYYAPQIEITQPPCLLAETWTTVSRFNEFIDVMP